MTHGERKLHIEPSPDKAVYSLKIAFATGDRHHVDQHFGTARGVLIYGIGREGWSLLEAIEYPAIEKQTHSKLPGRINDLKSCCAVYCIACGASAIRQLLGEDINPVKVADGADIHCLLAELRNELQGQPMGWLGRALKASQEEIKAEQRLHALWDEEW